MVMVLTLSRLLGSSKLMDKTPMLAVIVLKHLRVAMLSQHQTRRLGMTNRMVLHLLMVELQPIRLKMDLLRHMEHRVGLLLPLHLNKHLLLPNPLQPSKDMGASCQIVLPLVIPHRELLNLGTVPPLLLSQDMGSQRL